MNPKDRLIVALDVNSEEKAAALVAKLRGDVKIFKIGLELFSSCGPGIIDAVRKNGYGLFLDLKFHDIPNTAANAAAAVTRPGVSMFNVHALGGYEMMKRAAEAVKKEAARANIERPKILAVTVLTSASENDLKKLGINDNMKSVVLRLAGLAKDAGLDGVVASGEEAKDIKKCYGEDFLVVTPGVRPSWAKAGDQKRVVTPSEAIKAGADYIVVGRPVIEAPNPALAVKKILEEING